MFGFVLQLGRYIFRIQLITVAFSTPIRLIQVFTNYHRTIQLFTPTFSVD